MLPMMKCPHKVGPNIIRARPSRAPVARARVIKVSVSQAEPQTAQWEQFAANVSGEWEGVTVSFDADGTPQQLPERFVPGAYREWGVELFDWQSQCSCTTEGGQLRSTLRRLMPTVGCEADAVAFTEEASTVAAPSGDGSTAEALVTLPDGSYSAGPASFDAKEASKLRFEACFAMPGLSTEGTLQHSSTAGGTNGSPPRYRIKVAQNLQRNWMDGSWRLASVELHREKYDGPFTGRKELAGCGGGQPAISKLPAAADEQLQGSWAPHPGAASEAARGGAGAAAAGPTAGGSAIITKLPLGAWSVVRVDGAGDLVVEAGALAEGGQRRQVASRSYSGGCVGRAAIATEERRT